MLAVQERQDHFQTSKMCFFFEDFPSSQDTPTKNLVWLGLRDLQRTHRPPPFSFYLALTSAYKLIFPQGAPKPRRGREPVTLPPSQAPTDRWQWGGCSDNVRFGLKKSREFMDSRYRKRSDIKTLIKLHNHNAGRLVSNISRRPYV